MRLSVAFAALMLAAPAFAADYPGSPGPAPVLRGALPGVQAGTDWSGFYFGGSVGYGNATNAIANPGLEPQLQALVAGTAVATSMQQRPLIFTGRNQSGVMTFGGFLGFNYQSDDMVFGFEADYSRGKMKGDQTGRASGVTAPIAVGGGATRYENWNAVTTSNFEIKDSGTLRGRMGYTFGSFMPYLTAGIAWARASNERSATVSGTFEEYDATNVLTRNGILNFNPSTNRTGARTKLHFGYALGAGVDVALSQNIFFRAEAIHSRFSDIGGTNVQINQARASAGVKF